MKRLGGGLPLAAALWVLLASIAPAASAGVAHGQGSLRRHELSLKPDADEGADAKAAAADEKAKNDQLAEELAKSKKTISKIREMHREVPDMIKRDSEQLKARFLPGWKFDWFLAASTSSSVLIAVAWFTFYFHKLYETDRTLVAAQNGGAGVLAVENLPFSIQSKIQGDLVLVFPHPGCEAARVDSAVSSSVLRSAMVHNETSGGVLLKSEKVYERAKEHEDREASLSVMERAGHAREGLKRMMTSTEVEEQLPPSYTDATVALIQDLHKALPKMGFDVKTFSSVDYDEIYMAISLTSHEVGCSYLLRSSASLQIHHSVVAKLGISQPPGEIASSTPWIRYDPRTVEKLHRAGVLEKNDPRHFYKTFHGRDEEGFIISGSDRIRIIYKALSQHLDLDYALERGFLVDWYPAHNPKWIADLWSSWGSWSHLKDLSFVQPLQKMTDYFGSRVSFIFGWNGLYCKALIPLVVLAIMSELIAVVCKFAIGLDPASVHRKMVFGFGMIIILWSRIASNLWDREEGLLMKLWNLNPESQELTMRPSFYGELKPSPANLNVQEKQYPAFQANLRQIASALITLTFCGIVFAWVVAWTNMFEGAMDLTASICLSIQIVIFGVIFNLLTPILTDWENHKYQNTYYDSYLWKQCLFQTVNSYTAFFYLAVKQRYTAVGCPPGGCMSVLRTQLMITLLILSVSRIAEVVISAYIVKLKLWLEAYMMGEHDVTRFYTEEQSKLATYRLREQIQAMVQLVISLGFVLFFGAIAPATVPLTLAVFTVQLRASAFLLLRFTKRPVPRKQFGIGAWRSVVQTMMKGGVLFSAFLLTEFSEALRETPVITKMTVMVLFYASMQVLWICVDAFCPPKAEETEVLIARRRCVENVVAKKCEETESVSATSPGRPAQLRGITHDDMDRAIDEGMWDQIPCLGAEGAVGKDAAEA